MIRLAKLWWCRRCWGEEFGPRFETSRPCRHCGSALQPKDLADDNTTVLDLLIEATS